MSKSTPTIEQNLQRLLTASVSQPAGCESRLLASVLTEVKAQRGARRRTFRAVAWWAGSAAAAAILLLAVGLWQYRNHTQSNSSDEALVHVGPAVATRIGQVREFYGLVSLRNGEPNHRATPAQAIHSGQWIETRWGSQAEILLDDQSRFLVQPCSLVQIDQEDMKRIQLENGAFSAEVARQPAGKPLMIQTPAAQIQVLGTKLDVHVVIKPNGRKQTRVTVTSGRVRMDSADRQVLLLPNMEGIAEEGQPPVTRCLTSEVNEMARLIRRSQPLAQQAGLAAASPAIIDFNDDTSATVWAVVPVENRGGEPLRQYVLPCARSASSVQVFTLQGAALPVQLVEQSWRVDLSLCPVGSGEQAQLIVRIPDVQGLFRSAGSGNFTFDQPAGGTKAFSLVQVRLPAAANITDVLPKPLETRETLSRLIVTIPAESQQQWFVTTDP
jgi:ferric-dicitrate binding protein FerR (iron transport regulator)